MIPVVTAAQMRELDRTTIEDLGLPGAVLMENAGRAVADEVARLTTSTAEVAILCGSGNNGGDGYVCARWLRDRGYSATVYLAAGRPRPGTDAALHLEVLERSGGRVVELDTDAKLAGEMPALLRAGALVDALLGTGLKNEVRGHLAAVIGTLRQARTAGARLVAVDVPSGVDADTGRILGVAAPADHTVTLGLPKPGLVGFPGAVLAGELTIADIGIPRRLADKPEISLFLVERRDVAGRWHRDLGGHKGTYGHVLCLAGSPGKVGAGLLCARAALRAGAGLVTLAVPPEARAAAEGRVPEVMVVELDPERPPAAALADFEALAAGKDALAVGPGMPTTPAAAALLRALLPRLAVPAVVDADALNQLAPARAFPRALRAPIVLTPHPGEAGRLLEATTAEVQADRVAAARRLAAETGAVVVLKGARTVVAQPDGRALLNPTGNPGMGTGGTGDVLTGVIGALLAGGLEAPVAAFAGTYLHGHAGDLARASLGEVGLTAGDVIDALPQAFQDLA